MESLLENTSKADQRVAKASIGKLECLAKVPGESEQSVTIRFGEEREVVVIPKKAFDLLSVIVANMAEGKSMALVSTDSVIGTQEAADYLGVSRPHLVKLLENGEIPYTKAGTHRRVAFNDVLAYQNLLKERPKHLDELARQAQELNLGY